MCQRSSNSRGESCCICQHHSQSASALWKTVWEQSIEHTSHSESLCWVFWHSAGGKQGGGGQRHIDLVLKRPQSSGLALIVVLEWRKFWPSLIYLHTYIPIITDAAGHLPCEKSLDPASKYVFKIKASFIRKHTHTSSKACTRILCFPHIDFIFLGPH